MTDFQSAGLPSDFIEDSAVAPATGIAFTEGPAAAEDGNVYFSDIANNRIMRYDPQTDRTSVWRCPSGRANGLLFDAEGRFADFVESVGFVDRLVAPAEEMAHHPDVAISWNEVTVTVTTHSAGGLTAADFELAAKIGVVQQQPGDVDKQVIEID